MTATEERTALLRAVLAEPECDDVRLIYADHLEEYGDDNDRARAAAIRYALWVSRANRGDPSDPVEPAYWNEDQNFWQSRGVLCYSERGFVSVVCAPLRTLLDHGPAILRAHPVTRTVVTDKEPCNRCGAPHGHHWHPRGPLACDLPDAIWHNGKPELYYHWQSRDAALEALYAAVLARCKEEAGKP